MSSNIAALILMGGQNKRMNGQHKAFLTLDDISFLERLLFQLDTFSSVYLSVDDKTKFSHLPQPMIEDRYEQIGPMGGIASAFRELSEDYLFVTACDMPFINRTYTDYLQTQLTHTSADTTCIVLSDEKGFIYPLGAIYSKKLLPLMLQMIQGGHYRLRYLIQHTQSLIIPLSCTPFNSDIFMNINTPMDYQKLQQHHFD